MAIQNLKWLVHDQLPECFNSVRNHNNIKLKSLCAPFYRMVHILWITPHFLQSMHSAEHFMRNNSLSAVVVVYIACLNVHLVTLNG